MIQSRTSKHEFFLDLAERCAHQSTCLRRKFGVVIVNDRGHIISTGYNGSPVGMMHCFERGRCWRIDHDIPAGEDYTKCFSVHAEQNALLQAGKEAKGCKLYLAGLDENNNLISYLPCYICTKMIVNAGIAMVCIRDDEESYTCYNPVDLYKFRESEVLNG